MTDVNSRDMSPVGGRWVVDSWGRGEVTAFPGEAESEGSPGSRWAHLGPDCLGGIRKEEGVDM